MHRKRIVLSLDLSLFPSRSLPGVSAAPGEKTVYIYMQAQDGGQEVLEGRPECGKYKFFRPVVLPWPSRGDPRYQLCRTQQEKNKREKETRSVFLSFFLAVTLARHFELAFVGKGKLKKEVAFVILKNTVLAAPSLRHE